LASLHSPDHEGNLSDLIETAIRGDTAARWRVLRRYEPEVRATIRSGLGPFIRSRVDTDDVFQTVSMAAIEAFDRCEYRGERAFLAWLRGIAVCAVRSAARHHSAARRDAHRDRAWSTGLALPGSLTPPVVAAERGELAARVRASISLLPSPAREVVSLHSLEGLEYSEIARRLGLSGAAAARKIHQRALRRLLDSLDDST
jgi:RNA polymerase sigma-70 factor (ECF subfamily)